GCPGGVVGVQQQWEYVGDEGVSCAVGCAAQAVHAGLIAAADADSAGRGEQGDSGKVVVDVHVSGGDVVERQPPCPDGGSEPADGGDGHHEAEVGNQP